ncbi:hypothetical protein PV458_29355 [Streptomyces sp. MN03-5084-2B]|nr:hypothetical protein [Streptomyces sp. MN03-5084-2B]
MGVRLQFVFTRGKNHREVPTPRRTVTYARAVQRPQLWASGGQPGKCTA